MTRSLSVDERGPSDCDTAGSVTLPKVLVLSHQIPQTVFAGCILMHRLLRHYPAEKLLVIGPAVHPGADRLNCHYEALVPPFERLNFTRFAAMKRSLAAFGLAPKVPLKSIKQRIEPFHPQVIVSVMEGACAETAARLARESNIPLVLIVHDKQECFDQVYFWAQRRQIRANARVYAAATRRLCVSPEMEEHFRELYGESGEIMYPNRSEDLVARDPRESAKLKTPATLTVGYAGTMAYGYSTQLFQLGRALVGTRIRLRIYGNVDLVRYPLSTELNDVVQYCGLISPPERLWDHVKSECDAVLLPYTWDRDQSDLYRTHFPSKLPEYLALGMPVIVMGPEYATGVRWALDNQPAVMAITNPDPAEWVHGFDLLRCSPQLRTEMATSSLAAGSGDFDPVAIRRRFWRTLVDVVQPETCGATCKT